MLGLLAGYHLVLYLLCLICLLVPTKLLLKVLQVETLRSVGRLELVHGVLLALKIGECLVIGDGWVATRKRLVLGLQSSRPCQACLALQEALHVVTLFSGRLFLRFLIHACEAVHRTELILLMSLLLSLLLEGLGEVLAGCSLLLLLSICHLLR